MVPLLHATKAHWVIDQQAVERQGKEMTMGDSKQGKCQENGEVRLAQKIGIVPYLAVDFRRKA